MTYISSFFPFTIAELARALETQGTPSTDAFAEAEQIAREFRLADIGDGTWTGLLPLGTFLDFLNALSTTSETAAERAALVRRSLGYD